LLEKLQEERHLSILMITHNLGIVARIANRVVVMYAGKVVEDSTVKPLFKEPLHPYTQGLLKSIPNPEKKQRLYAIPGMIPDPANLPSGCTFHTRCPYVMDICKREFPPLNKVDDSRAVACWLY
jgi:oligopeptide/dipeptide ABC transporter ATP-binding protein